MTRLGEARAVLEQNRMSVRTDILSPSLFDAVQERDEGIERTLDTNRGQLLALLDAAVERVARSATAFTVDDVRDALADDDITPAQLDLRVLGAVLRNAARRGLIRSTGTYVPSRYRHASPLVLWQACDA